jgi:hypothetical protein
MKKFLPAFPKADFNRSRRVSAVTSWLVSFCRFKPSLHNSRYLMHKIGVVSAATGVPIPTLGRWHDRKTLKLSRLDKVSTGSGDHRLFSRATIDQIAIAKTLIDLGIAASPANRAAAHFTELFPCGRTLLLITPTDALIVNAEFSATLTDFCGRPFCSAVIVDCGHVIAAVDHALTSTKDIL